MFGRKRKQEQDNVGLAGLGTGGQDPFSSLSMGGHEPFSSPDPAVHVTAQPIQTTPPTPPTPPTASVQPTQVAQPPPQTPSPGAVTTRAPTPSASCRRSRRGA